MKQLFAFFILLTLSQCQKSDPETPDFVATDRSTYTISGYVYWEHDGVTGVKDVIVTLSGTSSGVDTTDASGYYEFVVPALGSYTLAPAKNINKLNGVTGADATAIQQHVANITLLPVPFKRIAADVNKSNSITTFDVTIVNQCLLGNPAALAQFKSSWRFVPASYSFPNPNAPWGFPESSTITIVGDSLSNNFIGIKCGDVNGTCNPAN